MTNPYAANMSVQSREGASNPDGIDYKDYPFRKLEKEGDKIKGKIVAQSNWIPTDQGGTRRIINLVNGDDKFSWSIDSDGKKQAIADALEDANLGDTRVGDFFGMQWVSTSVTKRGYKFRKYTAAIKRPGNPDLNG